MKIKFLSGERNWAVQVYNIQKKLSTIPLLVISKQILNEQSTMCIKNRHSDEDADMNRSNTLFQSICSLNEKYKIIEIWKCISK